MTLWTLKEMAAAVGAAYEGADSAVNGVSIDTRTLEAGNVFVALSGTPGGGFRSSFPSDRDGHDHVAVAVEKGAVGVLVSRAMQSGVAELMVPETHMEGLWKLGQAARARLQGKVVGLTGSAGKSTTKEYLAAMLDAYASVGSYNNFWGVPLTLARVPREAEFAVVEMGMNEPGEIGRLSSLTKPDVALVVNVRPVHLEHLGSLEAIRKEKLAIVEGLVDGGVLVVPADLKHDDIALPEGATVVTFGEDGDVRALGHAALADGVWEVEVEVAGERHMLKLADGAPHRVWNALAALACVHALGADMVAACERVGRVAVLDGRGKKQVAGGVTVLDDSFNGNPASMEAALLGLRSMQTEGRKIALLGEMAELGPEGPRYHAELAKVCEGLDGVYLVGELMAACRDALAPGLLLGYEPDPAAFDAEAFAQTLQAGDTLVVKASKRVFYNYKVVPRIVAALGA